jgi:hypothetical protein
MCRGSTEFLNMPLVAVSQKKIISALGKWKMGFSWHGKGNTLYGVASHPKAHARAQYGLIPTNYACPEGNT